MKTSTIVLVVGGIAVLGVVLVVATSRQRRPVGFLGGFGYGGGGTGSGIVRSIGAGLTGLVGAIVGGVETEEAAARARDAEAAAQSETPPQELGEP